jgi:hypothetical protein
MTKPVEVITSVQRLRRWTSAEKSDPPNRAGVPKPG